MLVLILMTGFVLLALIKTYANILKAHLHSMSPGQSVRASFYCHGGFWIAWELVLYINLWLLTCNFQSFKNGNDTQGKHIVNLHSMSVSVNEL